MDRLSASMPAATEAASSGRLNRRSLTIASAFCASQAPHATGHATTASAAPPIAISARSNQFSTSDRDVSPESDAAVLYPPSLPDVKDLPPLYYTAICAELRQQVPAQRSSSCGLAD